MGFNIERETSHSSSNHRTSRPATSRRPLRSWPPASRTARTTWCSWEPPVRARPRRPHGSSNGVQRPTLIIEPNKTLAAQLCAEFRELMPDNAVSYFVSYYDYYQPEAYIPQTDTYIEKDSNINDDVERLRHQATANLLTRRDCVVVATVSVHLRPRYAGGVRRPACCSSRKASRLTAISCFASSSACSTSATTSRSRAARSACVATPSRSYRYMRSWLSASSSSATRSTASPRCIR